MTTTTTRELYYDPYDYTDPYPVYRRLREEAPLYYNERHDFYAMSRFADVERGLNDREIFISSRGTVLPHMKQIKEGSLKIPPGSVIMEDPPNHTLHRGLLSGVITPKKMNALEPQIRAFCTRILDKLAGAKRFDFVRDIGAQVPMRVIGMLVGIPEEDQEALRDQFEANQRIGPGMRHSQEDFLSGEDFVEYIDWRAEHPTDDIMTQLLYGEFEDETGTKRRLTRQEVLTYIRVVAGAGNETTMKLIGWIGKVLADHPDQRRALVQNPSLIPNAVEEVLRYEPPAHQGGRTVARDVELYGQMVPEGSIILFLKGSANRDDRRFPNADRFDIRRKMGGQHLTFGHGIHFCLGAPLARVEGRIVLDEILKRFPDWEVDRHNARLFPNPFVRGWDTLPVFIP